MKVMGMRMGDDMGSRQGDTARLDSSQMHLRKKKGKSLTARI